jgi:Holliday junction resolvase RusA-like endonuclease
VSCTNWHSAEIPIPPSVNHMHVLIGKSKGKRVARSKQYQSWIDVTTIIMAITLPKFTKPVAIRIEIHSGDGWETRRDIDNVIKPVVDAIKNSGRIVNDNVDYVRKVEVEYLPGSGKARAVVAIIEKE